MHKIILTTLLLSLVTSSISCQQPLLKKNQDAPKNALSILEKRNPPVSDVLQNQANHEKAIRRSLVGSLVVGGIGIVGNYLLPKSQLTSVPLFMAVVLAYNAEAHVHACYQ